MEEIRGGKSYNFHYDRAERIAVGGDEKPPEPKGLFRRNRSLAIILLDVIVIVIMLLLFQFVFTPGRSWSRVGDYRVDLAAFTFETEVYATVEISRIREGQQMPTGSESLVVIRFDGREDLLDVLPMEIDGRITATAIYPAAELQDGAPVRVELDLLGETVSVICTPKE
jgi:hypothetical protein